MRRTNAKRTLLLLALALSLAGCATSSPPLVVKPPQIPPPPPELMQPPLPSGQSSASVQELLSRWRQMLTDSAQP